MIVIKAKAKKLTVLRGEAITIRTRFKNPRAYKGESSKLKELTVPPNRLGRYRAHELTLSP